MKRTNEAGSGPTLRGSGLAVHTVTVYCSDAAAVRELLDQQDGITYTERQRWMLWRQFTVSGMTATVEGLAERVRGLQRELWRDRQW